MDSIIEQPSKGSFDHPSALKYGKAGGLFFNHFQRYFVGTFQLGDPRLEGFASIAAIDPHFFESGHPMGSIAVQQGLQAVGVGYRRSGNHPFKHASVGIDQQVALASLDLFAGIVSNGGTLLGGFDALRVDDASRGPRTASLLGSILGR